MPKVHDGDVIVIMKITGVLVDTMFRGPRKVLEKKGRNVRCKDVHEDKLDLVKQVECGLEKFSIQEYYSRIL
jgi:hypothetical protein